MIEINLSRWVQNPLPFVHQIEGVKLLVKHAAFMLGDRPRTMKSRQVVDAACILREAGLIDLVLVIARVAGRGVWGNARIGQIKKWSWLPVRVHEFHQKRRDLWKDEGVVPDKRLLWVVTNYDYMRSEKNLAELMESLKQFKAPWVVFDESHKLGNENSLQAKAAMKLCWDKEERRTQDGKHVLGIRWHVRIPRRSMLTGTPGGPLKQWSQFNILNHTFDRRYKSVFSFKCVFGEWDKEHPKMVPMRTGKGGGRKLRVVHQQTGWKDLDKLSRITAPIARMLERKDCPGVRDVPVVSTFKEVRLSKETWKLYQSLKRDAIAELSTGETYVSPNKGVCLVRLSQICNGHLGGFEEGDAVRWLSDEKIDFLAEELTEECTAENILVWCRYRLQQDHIASKLRIAGFKTYQIYGGLNKTARSESEMIFSEGTIREVGKRYALISQVQAGGDSNDFSAASDVYRLSDVWGDWSTFHQSNERPLGPGQKAESVSSTDVIATGPNGERTMDHIQLEAREQGRILEKLTCQEWIQELTSD